jgi:ketosteroid isomerase-like protein
MSLSKLSLLLIASVLASPSAIHAQAARSDSADAVAVVARFHASLAAGDSAAALSLLSADALIVETGGVETRSDYRAHHLPADIKFAQAVPAMRTVVRVTVQGDAAWIVSTSVSQGESNGRPVNSAGAELVVLRRGPSGWLITAVHWSSRNRRS